MAAFSIIVPVYKTEDYLPQCIESIISQTLRDIEIILVDDGSPDGCAAICDEYAKSDARIKVIHKQNEGVCAARNDGLNIARGEWVLFCDSDDWLEKEACAKVIEVGEQNIADIVIGDFYQYTAAVGKRVILFEEGFVSDDKAFINRLIAAQFCSGYIQLSQDMCNDTGVRALWNKAIRRKLFIENNIKFEDNLKGVFEDGIVNANLFAVTAKIAYMQLPIYNYRLRKNSISHEYKSDFVEISRSVIGCWQEFLDRYNDEGIYSRPFYANVIRLTKSLLDRCLYHELSVYSARDAREILRRILRTEPYKTAFRKAEFGKLQNSYDKVVFIAVKLKLANTLGIFAALVRFLKKHRSYSD
jgi:glycosyltransferase involved in cell wall biosynthesis